MYYGAVLYPVPGRPNFIREIVDQGDDHMAHSRDWQPGGRRSTTTCLLTGHHVNVRLHSVKRLCDAGMVRGEPGSTYEVMWLIISDDDPDHCASGRHYKNALKLHEARRRKHRKGELYQPKRNKFSRLKDLRHQPGGSNDLTPR